jgi:hypothetical protein
MYSAAIWTGCDEVPGKGPDGVIRPRSGDGPPAPSGTRTGRGAPSQQSAVPEVVQRNRLAFAPLRPSLLWSWVWAILGGYPRPAGRARASQLRDEADKAQAGEARHGAAAGSTFTTLCWMRRAPSS